MKFADCLETFRSSKNVAILILIYFIVYGQKYDFMFGLTRVQVVDVVRMW